MVSKKYTLLAGLFCLLASYGISQTTMSGSGYDVADSSVVPSKKLPQYTEFMNGTYNFPPKPKNQWEIGFKYGVFQIIGDVPALFFTAPNFGVHIRKALGYTFSLRLEYLYGVGKGLEWRYAQNFGKNNAWNTKYNAPVRTNNNVTGTTVTGPGGPFDKVYYNYKTKVQDLSLQAVVNFTNILFHKATVGTNVYGFAGFGATTYDANINALNASGGTYAAQFNSIAQVAYDKRKDTRDALKDLLDDTYETPAQSKGAYGPQLGDNPLRLSGIVGLGIAFKLSKNVNLAVENRWNIVKDDLLDGQQWQEQTWGDASVTRSNDIFTFTSVGLNINIGRHRVAPLYWLNPLEYAYQEIRKPKHMILPKPVLPDSDGDGVTDQFDREQTPAGAPVDTHGVSRDTDGDGVPDYKDKELVTPTYCQPVDADGVGKCPVPCPAPECFPKPPPATECATQLGALPSVSFKANSNVLTDDAKAVLATVAGKMRNAPECKVVVVGYGSTSKPQQQLSWDHVNKVINYLVENEGISNDRFIFKYGEDGPNDTVDLRSANAGEEGPNTVSPPHPSLQKK